MRLLALLVACCVCGKGVHVAVAAEEAGTFLSGLFRSSSPPAPPPPFPPTPPPPLPPPSPGSPPLGKKKKAKKKKEIRSQISAVKREAEAARREAEMRKEEEEKRETERRSHEERRATRREEAEIEKDVLGARAAAEAEGRIRESRELEDLSQRALVLRLRQERKQAVELAGEETKRSLEVAGAVMGHVGTGLSALITDYRKMGMVAGGIAVMALGVYVSREGARVGGRAFDRWLKSPALVRETSRSTAWWRPARGTGEGTFTFRDMVLEEELMEQARTLAASTANTKRNRAPFRHILMYGPPGTGKTMFAKILARQSGLDYAIMTGGDVGPLGKHAVTMIHELFDWLESSRKGCLLFIDEADAFLSKRDRADMSESIRSALNAVLYRTGTQTKNFVMVLATNRPGDLDEAVTDRMDEVIHFGLPGREERMHLLELYLGKYLLAGEGADGGGGGRGGGRGPLGRLWRAVGGGGGGPRPIYVEGVTEAVLHKISDATDGFSGRELAKLMAAAQSAAYGRHDSTLTSETLMQLVARKVREHSAKGGGFGSYSQLPV